MTQFKYDVLPANVRVSIVTNDGFSMLMSAKDPATTLPIPLVGFTFVGGVFDASWNKVADFLMTPVDLPNGKVNASLTQTQTISLGAGTYNWSFQWTDTSTQKRTILSGSFILVNAGIQ